MNFKIGSFVSRNSYGNDVVFKIIKITGNVCYLKGEEVRLLADAPIDDLKIETEIYYDNYEEKALSRKNLRNSSDDYFYLPGKVLHIDGDSDFLERCLTFYKNLGIMAIGKKIEEKNIYSQVGNLLNDYRPDIVIFTGHDSYNKKKNDIHDNKNYKNTEYFIKAIKEARKYEKSHEKLIIIAGACQSNYEELIKAGANFASSPKRVNIHALDPAIIASSIALTKRNEEIDLLALLNKTKYGKDGFGGIVGNGVMYVGYPR